MSIAVIAGGGQLPSLVLENSAAQLVAMEGVAVDVRRKPDFVAQFERLGALFERLTSSGVTEIVFAGAMGRPALDPSRFDPVTAQMLPRLLPLLQQGDDALLSGIIREFEAVGFDVRAAHELVPDLLVADGVLGQHRPTDADKADALRGIAVLNGLGDLDVGQGCISCAGQVLGIEALYGTDALLQDVASRRNQRQPQTGGVFVKRAKPGQDLRIDLPTIGPDTIQAVRSAKLSGICLQAGHVQVLDKATVLRDADAAGLAIWACP